MIYCYTVSGDEVSDDQSPSGDELKGEDFKEDAGEIQDQEKVADDEVQQPLVCNH